MTASCVLSPRAENDLEEILLRIAENSQRRAITFTEEILERCINLAENPGIGRMRDDLQLNVRSFAYGSYVIFYTEEANGIRIERIIHGARDMQKLFADGP